MIWEMSGDGDGEMNGRGWVEGRMETDGGVVGFLSREHYSVCTSQQVAASTRAALSLSSPDGCGGF